MIEIMYGDEIEKGERIGERQEQQPGQYAETWDGVMEESDVPEFNGGKPWGYVEPATESIVSPEVEADVVGESQYLQGAGKMAGYGLDTASKMYGLGTVLEAIKNTDESDRDAANPIGTIYTQVAPTPEARRQLYTEIQKDAAGQEAATEAGADNGTASKLGMDAEGNFYAKSRALDRDGTVVANQKDEANQAVWATKKLLNALDDAPAFAGLRERAAESGMSTIDYLVRDQVNPTLSQFLGAMGGEMGGVNADEMLANLEQTEEKKDMEDMETEIEAEIKAETAVGVEELLGEQRQEIMQNEELTKEEKLAKLKAEIEQKLDDKKDADASLDWLPGLDSNQ